MTVALKAPAAGLDATAAAQCLGSDAAGTDRFRCRSRSSYHPSVRSAVDLTLEQCASHLRTCQGQSRPKTALAKFLNMLSAPVRQYNRFL